MCAVVYGQTDGDLGGFRSKTVFLTGGGVDQWPGDAHVFNYAPLFRRTSSSKKILVSG